MNWRNIELYDLPPCSDVLMRIENVNGEVCFIVGDVDEDRVIYTRTDWRGEYEGWLCHISGIRERGIKSIHYIDPNEILM